MIRLIKNVTDLGKLRDGEQVLLDEHRAIVDSELWERANAEDGVSIPMHPMARTFQSTFAAWACSRLEHATSATAVLNINPAALAGPRRVTLTTGTEMATLGNGFTVVGGGNQQPIVTAGANQTISLQSAPVTSTEYPVPTPGGGPLSITTGPDGNLWFTENTAGNKIGRITSGGVFTEFSVPTSGSGDLQDIVTGPDGNLWFTEYFGSKIWRITTAGVLTPFLLTSGSFPLGITAGPDGNLWFTERFRNNIGRITTAGVITEPDRVVRRMN